MRNLKRVKWLIWSIIKNNVITPATYILFILIENGLLFYYFLLSHEMWTNSDFEEGSSGLLIFLNPTKYYSVSLIILLVLLAIQLVSLVCFAIIY